jgi:DMSO reductase anchor subunit
MRGIILYELLMLAAAIFAFLLPDLFHMPEWYVEKIVPINCALIGLLGGVLYCLRGIYVNRSVKGWDSNWHVWYYLRPLTSAISGFVSYVILIAGLLTLDAEQGDTEFGFYAFAFIAGYNVDKFLQKLEDVAKTIWGIDKSRSGEN